MGNAGNYIYSGFIPLVKMGIAILAGYYLTKKGLFPPEASKGASHLAMTIALPCLIFASVVPAFNSDNIRFLGPLCLNAVVYELCGLVLGIVIREVFYVPSDFYYGIVIACVFSNWGNLPTAVVQTIATQDPFDPAKDPTLGVAYVSVFMLIYSITFFGIGTCKICAWDFHPRPDGQVPMTRHEKWQRRKKQARTLYQRLRSGKKAESMDSDGETPAVETLPQQGSDVEMKPQQRKSSNVLAPTDSINENDIEPVLARYRSPRSEYMGEPYSDGTFLAPVSSTLSRTSRTITARNPPPPAAAAAPLTTSEKTPSIQRRSSTSTPREQPQESLENAQQVPTLDLSGGPTTKDEFESAAQTAPADARPSKSMAHVIWNSIKLILSPVSISLFVALPIALVTPLKALFTNVEGWTGGKMPNGPDGKPPLAFLLDTANFIGALCIPVGLMLLGASFARIKIPRPWTKLPIPAMCAVMLGKMILIPVIGVGMTEGLSNTTNLYPPEEKMLKFVAMLLSGTPSAVNQLVITQLYSPDGSADTLSIFLIPQYIFMFLASAGLAAIALVFVN